LRHLQSPAYNILLLNNDTYWWYHKSELLLIDIFGDGHGHGHDYHYGHEDFHNWSRSNSGRIHRKQNSRILFFNVIYISLLPQFSVYFYLCIYIKILFSIFRSKKNCDRILFLIQKFVLLIIINLFFKQNSAMNSFFATEFKYSSISHAASFISISITFSGRSFFSSKIGSFYQFIESDSKFFYKNFMVYKETVFLIC
jgi:hypothetical protein